MIKKTLVISIFIDHEKVINNILPVSVISIQHVLSTFTGMHLFAEYT